MSENIHEGHRKRVLDDFLKNGFDEHTPPHKILEFLLFYCIPQKDTNETAHELINKFGSFSGVLDAPPEEIAKVKNMSLRSAALLKTFIPVSIIYNNEKASDVNRFHSISEIGTFIFDRMKNYQSEKFGVLILGTNGKFKSFEIISSGDIGSVNVSVRSLIKLCLDRDAVIVAITHCHPSGVALPSNEDVELTKRISDALLHAGIMLVDHVIVVNNDYVSMAESSEYAYIFKH